MRAIIPAAGYGTRMGMKPNESKEMLYDRKTCMHIIDYSINLCRLYGVQPLVILRKEKMDLYYYCEDELGVNTMMIEPSGEWPDTVLASESRWDEYNILILPDTRFEPTNVIQLIKNDLENGAMSSIALHSVTDSCKWCIVKDYDLIEKPTLHENAWAMGLIGFHKSEGSRLFKGLRTRGAPCELIDASFQYLNRFEDITRP